jgi:hypothetical protein
MNSHPKTENRRTVINPKKKLLEKIKEEVRREIGEFSFSINHKIHLDFLLSLLLIVIAIFAMTSWFTNNNKDNYTRKDLVDVNAAVVAVIGILITARNIHEQYHHNKMSKASHYVELWYSPQLQPGIKIIRDIKDKEFDAKIRVRDRYCPDSSVDCLYTAYRLKEDNPNLLEEIQKSVAEKIKNEHNERQAISEVLNFFEQMGQDVRLNVADENYLKEFFFHIVISYYEIFKKCIENRQHESSQITFCNFVYLAETWEKWRTEPQLPQICRRAEATAKS